MWETIWTFILTQWPYLLIILAFIGVLIFLAKKGYESKVKRALFYLVCEAEKEFGSGTGTLKYEAVVNWAYDLVPTWLNWVISKKTLDTWIEAAVAELKEWLLQEPKATHYFAEPVEHTE